MNANMMLHLSLTISAEVFLIPLGSLFDYQSKSKRHNDTNGLTIQTLALNLLLYRHTSWSYHKQKTDLVVQCSILIFDILMICPLIWHFMLNANPLQNVEAQAQIFNYTHVFCLHIALQNKYTPVSWNLNIDEYAHD